jgi:hypothetical protein
VINSSLCHDEMRDVIVPDGYVARRLFWSTIEPWRIVEYEILTELEPECSIEEVRTITGNIFCVPNYRPIYCLVGLHLN